MNIVHVAVGWDNRNTFGGGFPCAEGKSALKEHHTTGRGWGVDLRILPFDHVGERRLSRRRRQAKETRPKDSPDRLTAHREPPEMEGPCGCRCNSPGRLCRTSPDATPPRRCHPSG